MTSKTPAAPVFDLANLTAETFAAILTGLLNAVESHADDSGTAERWWCASRRYYLRKLSAAYTIHPDATRSYPNDYLPVIDVAKIAVPAAYIELAPFLTDEGQAHIQRKVSDIYAREVSDIIGRTRSLVSDNILSVEQANAVLTAAGLPAVSAARSFEVTLTRNTLRVTSTNPEDMREDDALYTALNTALAEDFPAFLLMHGLKLTDESKTSNVIRHVSNAAAITDGPTVPLLTLDR